MIVVPNDRPPTAAYIVQVATGTTIADALSLSDTGWGYSMPTIEANNFVPALPIPQPAYIGRRVSILRTSNGALLYTGAALAFVSLPSVSGNWLMFTDKADLLTKAIQLTFALGAPNTAITLAFGS